MAAGIAASLPSLFALSTFCGIMVYFATKPHCPKHVEVTDPESIRLDVLDKRVTYNDGWSHIIKHVNFDPLSKSLELWLKVQREMDLKSGAFPLLDGYLILYANDKTCAFGKCPIMARYDLEMGVTKQCTKCPPKFYSGGTPEPHVRIEERGALVPRFDLIETCGGKVSATKAETLMLLAQLPSEIREWSNVSMEVNVGATDGLGMRFIVSEKAGML